MGLLVLAVAVIVPASFLAVSLALQTVRIDNDLVHLLIETGTLTLVSALGLWFVVVQPLRRDAAGEREATRAREEELQAEARRQEFDARVHRAMEMAATEVEAYAAARRALDRGTSRLGAELLLADSSDAHLKRAVESAGPSGAAPGCGVGSPRACPPIRRSQTLMFATGEDIDTCPHLAARVGADTSAVCVPVSVGGRSIGVLHATAPSDAPPAEDEVSRLESLATQAGSRIGTLRVMEATHLQAATDPLTGLLNRRSFENRLQDLLARGSRGALAMCDLDHFKLLNDTHGHDAGDRALRLFARTLREAVRSQDLVCRYGGEEFIVAFPSMTAIEAAGALQRVQEGLVLAVAGGTVPGFTASFGVAMLDAGMAFEEACRAADGALFRAKREGRNRVVIDSTISSGPAVAGQATL